MPETPTTPNERKRAERERKRQAGLKPGEVWVKPKDWPMIRELERKLRS